MEELLALILETDLENEDEIDQALAETNLDDQSQQALKGAIKLLNAHRENLTPEVVKSLLTKAGFAVEETPPAEPEPEVLYKEDGTLNLDGVPEQLRPAIQALWEGKQTAEEMKDDLEKTLKAERNELRKKEVVRKVKEWKVPGASTDELADLMMKAEDEMPEESAILEKVLASVSNLIKNAETMKEIGTGNESEPDSDYDRAVKKARKLMDIDPAMSLGVAIDTVFQADRELAEEHQKETR
ncbi:MAG: hypothetical protein AMJ65_06850 [Phycisphaerae bacterium SG8_4]|nr:MAG: hypothetical protein AMJ65_06850 [Phycisphaerae bacterium SG8_4]